MQGCLAVIGLILQTMKKNSVAIPDPLPLPFRVFDLGVQYTPFDDIAHERLSRKYRRYKAAVCEEQTVLLGFEYG